MTGINFRTAQNIISRYNTTGQTTPKQRGGANNIRYDKALLIPFLLEFFSLPDHVEATLEEAQEAIVQANLHKPSGVPSISWISETLHNELITLKKVTVSPMKRNAPQTIIDRYNYVMWKKALTQKEQHRLVFLDEHGFDIWTHRSLGRSKKGSRVVSQRPSCRSVRCNNLLLVSPFYGKIHCLVWS